MKKLLIFSFAMLALLTACKKSSKSASTTTYISTATIMGLEPFMTDCDARYWIRIDDPTAGRTFDSLPAGATGINPNFFPGTDSIKVKLNWHNTGYCARVVIDAIERVD